MKLSIKQFVFQFATMTTSEHAIECVDIFREIACSLFDCSLQNNHQHRVATVSQDHMPIKFY